MSLNPPALKTNRYSQSYKQNNRKRNIILPQMKFRLENMEDDTKQFRHIKIQTRELTVESIKNSKPLNPEEGTKCAL